MFWIFCSISKINIQFWTFSKMLINMLNSLKNCTTANPSSCFNFSEKIEHQNVRLSFSEVLVVCVNALNTDDKYPLPNRKNYWNQFSCYYPRNKKIVLKVLWHIWNLHQILHILQKSISHRGYALFRLETVKDVVS